MDVAEHGYSRLADQDRSYIKKRLDLGDSLRRIADDMKVAASTVSRALSRNGGADGRCDRRPRTGAAADASAQALHEQDDATGGQRNDAPAPVES